MSRRDIEKSRALGRPRYYYHFFRSTQDWYYTSYRTALSYAGDTYLPLEITHSDIERGSEDNPGSVQITLPTDSPLGLVLQAGSSPTPVSVQISMLHMDAVDDPAIIFNGELRGADFDGARCTVQAVPLQSRMSMILPRGLFQRDKCVWNTFDPLTCGLNPVNYTFNGTVAAINGLSITVTGAGAFNADPSFFKLGVLTFGEYKSMIESQDGDVVTLQFGIPGLAVGSAVSLLAGDDRTKETCKVKFNNIERYLAFSQMPVENPHYGQGLRT